MQLNLFDSLRSDSSVLNFDKLKDNFCYFDGLKIEIIRKPFKRTFALGVLPNGKIQVSVGKSVKGTLIMDYIQKNQNWLHKQISRFEKLRKKYPLKKYQEAECFLFLGKKYYLHFEMVEGKESFVSVLNDQLVVYVPKEKIDNLNFSNFIKENVKNFYKQKGVKILNNQINFYSKLMNINPTNVSIKEQKSRWGSCSPSGKLSLNWKLVVAPLEVIDYVIIHELCHFKHFNHSKLFWKEVANYCPEYINRRKWLNDNLYEMDFLSKKSELYFS